VRDADFASPGGKYYIVVGAFKTVRVAKEFQQVLRRELNEQTSVIQKSNGHYFFVYTREVLNKDEALQELARLKDRDTKNLFVGDPWMYQHPK
jgi:hypothetical protein